MRFLEVRRHSFTKKGDARGRGSHLSNEGVRAARGVGAQLGPIAYAVVSESPRTLETAIAMGVAVDDILPLGAGYSTPEVAHHDQWTWTTPYVRYRELLERGGRLADASARELGFWRAAVDHITDGDVALLVSHGGSIEPTLVAALPDAQVDEWGAPFSHLDGVRLAFNAESFDLVEFHRYGTGRNVNDVQCRPAGAQDFTFLATMLGEAAVWRPDKPTPTGAQVLADPRYALYLAGWPWRGDYGLVAEEDGPVGAAWYRSYTAMSHGYGFVAEDVPELSIAVIASRRHEGIGRRLLIELIEASVAQGYRALSLSVNGDNPARGLYQSVGFQPVEQHGSSWTMVRPATQPR